MDGSAEPGRRDLIDRLLADPGPPPAEATTRETAQTDAPERAVPPPPGATFVVPDDWDTARGSGGPRRPSVPVGPAVRGWFEAAAPVLRHAARLAVFALAVLGAAGGLVVAWFHVTSDPLADAHAYFDAAARLNAGQPLYPAGIDPSTNLAYLYPPLLAIVLRPLAMLGYQAFSLAWELIVVASFVLLLRHLGIRSRRTWLAIGLLGIPIGWSIAVAQAHVPLTLLLALGQPWSVALAANLKLFPAAVALWWIGRRDWQALLAFAGWMAVFALVQMTLEPNGTFAYVRVVGLGELGEVRNISPYVASPLLWAVLVLVGVGATLVLARTRWGWPVVVSLATLASPRLLVYMLMGLLAGIREPGGPGLQPPPATPWQRVSASGRH